MTRYVLLDGRYVPAEQIDPALHKFIGMFRPAVNPVASSTCSVLCTCGHTLHTRESGEAHYRGGCFDTNQYVTMEEK